MKQHNIASRRTDIKRQLAGGTRNYKQNELLFGLFSNICAVAFGWPGSVMFVTITLSCQQTASTRVSSQQGTVKNLKFVIFKITHGQSSLCT
jgi:hypothetical protein